ncbi:MAG: hypothetical protein LBH01_03035 [Verrucomicrobiales bacterium]|jgi:hypothetical protein|nr:hypothetical protein [Verrucomicrobiales bacterium]
MNNIKKIQKYLPMGALGISIILHLLIFLGISGIIIIQAVAPKTPFTAAAPTGEMQNIPPPPDPQDESPTPDTSMVDATDDAAPTAPAMDLTQISANAAAPTFNVAPTLGISTASTSGVPGLSRGSGKGAKGVARVISNPFGSSDVTSGALIGSMYDLKQTTDRKPTEFTPDTANDAYQQFIQKFIDSGWNQNLLNRFYKVEKPLGNYQLFIPTMTADAAPAAFKAEQYVKPKRWIIIYHGSFVAPEDGSFRFVGMCDDILVVRLNNNTVMDGSLFTAAKNAPRTKLGLAYPGAGALYQMLGGSWFQLSEGQTYAIDILIGERPGGYFNAFLLIQKQGVNYPPQPGGKDLCPVLPIFQVTASPVPSGKPAPKVAVEPFSGK